MTFRDDREAMLARTEALEREAERLRRENAALRAQVEQTHEVRRRRGEVEKLAAHAQAPVKPPAPKPEAARPRTRAVSLLDTSLSTFWSRLVWPVGLFSWPLVFLGLILFLEIMLSWLGTTVAQMGIWSFVILGFELAGYIGGLVFAQIAVTRLEARRERRRLAALPFALELDPYLAVLATEHSHKALEVRVAFSEPPPEDVRQTLADAVRGGLPRRIDAVVWRGGELVIVSPEFQTYRNTKSGSRSDNVALHRWFRRLARKALIPIARAYPVSSVRVS